MSGRAETNNNSRANGTAEATDRDSDSSIAKCHVSPPAAKPAEPPQNPPAEAENLVKRTWRFWAIFPPLCLATLFFSLESTVTSTSLPEITSALHAGNNYVWFLNAYLLTSSRTVFIPFYGQFATVFGRRRPTMLAVAIFTLGSGISGGANSSGMLISGRLVQGLGAAGIGSMTNIIIGDLVSVRERGKYLGIIFAVFGIGIAIGPTIGGVIAESGHWRWVFWLNLPLGGVTLILQFFFLQVTYKKMFTFKQKLKQIDWFGNFLLICSMVAILIALSWADTRYEWQSWHILVPLLIGFAGMVAFHYFEATKWCIVPTIPGRMFTNRTVAVCLINTFLSSMLTFWRIYFLPLYLQGVLLASPRRSGVLLLPSVLTAAPAAVISGFALTKWGRYKPIHLIGNGLVTLAAGLYINLGVEQSLTKIVIYQIIAGFGSGVLLTTILPAVQGAMPQQDIAPASATWAYLRAFGSIWGISIPSAIFNTRFDHYAKDITDHAVRTALAGGSAYSHVSNKYLYSLPEGTRQQVINAYMASIRNVWEVCLAFSMLAFLLTWLEKEIPMRTTVQSNHTLKEGKKAVDPEAPANSTQEGEKQRTEAGK
ncbi:Efflux pump roqT [Beauveria bassiana]|nr:Efflux pump roqT [Beauveria bassiana]KAH8708331.1 Efflux pump FUS6 [Beauveria bassiana]